MAVPKNRGLPSLRQAGVLGTTVSGGPAGQVLSGASQPEQALRAAYPSQSEELPNQCRTDRRLCDLCATNEGELVETSGKAYPNQGAGHGSIPNFG